MARKNDDPFVTVSKIFNFKHLTDMPDNTENPTDTSIAPSFESAMAELGRLIAQLEEGELPLEASITAYQRGVELVRFCTEQLEKVDRQIEILDKDMLKPFQPDSSPKGSSQSVPF